MFWKVSRFRAGDLVEVCDKEEILATLDERGCVDGLPFMPEMLQYCRQRFRVRAVAHKTCETAKQTWQGRRLRSTVHLENLCCDGSAHGGCEAACTLFWKDAWLKPVGANGDEAASSNVKRRGDARTCSEEQLMASTQLSSVGGELRYACQATMIYDATDPLAWWDVRQYVLDVVTGNCSSSRVLRVLWLASLRNVGRVFRHVPILRSVYAAFAEWMHKRLTGRGVPSLFKTTPPCVKTPTGRLGLEPGELVRIKSKAEIEATLDAKGLNRGLSFDSEEMAPYCGRVVRVRASVTKIIDEMTGEMRHMKQPCITLEGVVCQSEYARCRLNCPRAIPSYWRELWLERVEVNQPQGVPATEHQATELAASAS